jgi:hypothetical protein
MKFIDFWIGHCPEHRHFDKWCKQSLINTNQEQFSIKLLLNIEKYYIITKMTAPLQYSVWWVKRSLKFKFELWQPMKVKSANQLILIIDEICHHMGDTSTKSRYFINDWYLEQMFSLHSCNYGFIYLQILA